MAKNLIKLKLKFFNGSSSYEYVRCKIHTFHSVLFCTALFGHLAWKRNTRIDESHESICKHSLQAFLPLIPLLVCLFKSFSRCICTFNSCKCSGLSWMMESWSRWLGSKHHSCHSYQISCQTTILFVSIELFLYRNAAIAKYFGWKTEKCRKASF